MSEVFLNPLTGKVVVDQDNSCSDPECCGGPYPHWADQENIEVVQFTGHKDKHDREIYEGDILQIINPFDSNGRVGRFEVKIPDIFTWQSRHPFKMEVVGNIYNNPELLTSV